MFVFSLQANTHGKNNGKNQMIDICNCSYCLTADVMTFQSLGIRIFSVAENS